MAYRSNGRGGSSRSSGGYSSRKGGSNNALAYGAAGLVLAVVVVLVMTLKGGKKPEPQKTDVGSAPPTAQPTTPPPPTKPAEAPYPAVDPQIITDAKALVKTFEGPAALAQRLYDEGLRAKQAGDDATWQSKMEEASQHLTEIQDQWNELIQRMPTSKSYDEEQVANHVLGREGNVVNRALSLLSAIHKTQRMK